MPMAYNPALVKRGRKLSDHESGKIAEIKRPKGRQLLMNDIVGGYHYDREMSERTAEWLRQNSN